MLFDIKLIFKNIFLNNQIDSYSEQADKLLPKQLKITTLASGFKFAESHLWHPHGFVLVADVAANKIYKVLHGVIIMDFRYMPLQRDYVSHLWLGEFIFLWKERQPTVQENQFEPGLSFLPQ
jgi:hypothetical protein